MIRRTLVAFLLLATTLIPSPARAVVGDGQLQYFEWCLEITDLDCFESATFKYSGKSITYTQPGELFGNPEAVKTNIGYIWSPPGFIGADGGNRLRIEARYANRNLDLMVAGAQTRLMNPLPEVCKSDPTLPCVLTGTLPEDLHISVTLRTSDLNFTPGLSMARMFDPVVNIEGISGGKKLTFSGYPMRIMGYLNYAGSKPEIQIAAPTGDYINTIWMINYSNSESDPKLKTCLDAGSLILFSNAEKSNIPLWNAAEATVEMRTQSSHFEPDGVTPFKGVYFARISDGMVKCLWNVNPSNAAGQAEIAIVYDDGQKSLGTFSVTRKDGWLYVNGANFTYSSPTIKLKIKKAAPLKSISCVKGKLTKKVTAVQPKCPPGYKLK